MSFKKIAPYLLSLIAMSSFARNAEETAPVIPLKIPLYLSGNFGELRSNHFHSGIDFKTQGRTGLPVYSFDEGWVSRIGVSAWGYGNVLYVSHPNGTTSVYAHLESFSPFIEEVVKKIQYKKETFTLDQHFKKGEIPVKRGQQIAKSGNSGSSGGPHVHFEIRDSESQDVIDPIYFFKDQIKDNRKPEIRAVRLYPLNGVVNGEQKSVTANMVKKENGNETLDKTFTAWGEIGLGIKAYDRMSETTNIYGVKRINLYLDDKLIFSTHNNRISFSETSYLNSLTDYADWKKNRSMVVKMFLEPGNLYSGYGKMVNRGVVKINEERVYKFRYELEDAHENKTVFKFNVTGVKQPVPAKEKGENPFRYDRKNSFKAENFEMTFPKGVFYTDVDFKYSATPSQKYYSDIHKVHENTTPLHSRCEMVIKLTNDTLPDKSKYYLGTLGKNSVSYVGAEYKNGAMHAKVRDFGTYVVTKDTTKPVITPFAPENWGKTGKLTFKISDAHSGIRDWRGEIDGEFALFEFDGKTAKLSYKIDTARIGKGKKHKLILTVIDNCGNEKKLERSFNW